MPIGALVGAAPSFNAEHFRAQRFDCVIAVDGGLQKLREIGVKPDLALGDFDSLGYVPEGENVLEFPAEKDASDMELAIRGAAEGGCNVLLFYGGLGGRLDHTLANLQIMLSAAQRGLHVAAIGGDFVVCALHGAGVNSLYFSAFEPEELDEGSYGRCLSVFAWGGTAQGVCLRGLKYPLQDADLPEGVSLGLSNEFTGSAVRISVAEGSLLLTFPLGAWRHLRAW